MSSIDERIAQCEKDKKAIDENLVKLKEEKRQTEPKWIVAINTDDGGIPRKIILNLLKLSDNDKYQLIYALQNNHSWASIHRSGIFNTSGKNSDGLLFYNGVTKIVL